MDGRRSGIQELVIPAKAGIQLPALIDAVDSGFRRNDECYG